MRHDCGENYTFWNLVYTQLPEDIYNTQTLNRHRRMEYNTMYEYIYSGFIPRTFLKGNGSQTTKTHYFQCLSLSDF